MAASMVEAVLEAVLEAATPKERADAQLPMLRRRVVRADGRWRRNGACPERSPSPAHSR